MEGCYCLEGWSPSIKEQVAVLLGFFLFCPFAPLALASDSLGLCLTKTLTNDVRFCLYFHTCVK